MVGYALIACAIVLSFFVWKKLSKAFSLFRINVSSIEPHDLDALPSVSLCIPARNEMHAMAACLESALSSSYPKLEIIVLDDGSRDDTGHLIRSFAYSGIRFVEGSPLPPNWLGKNHALQNLLEESSGSYVLFSDVDTRFKPDSISKMVAYMKKENVDMMSVLPYRQNTMRASAIFATFRHFWNIVSHTSSHPAVASNAWMVKRSVLTNDFDGFLPIAMDVRPEKTIAQHESRDGLYRFAISSHDLGISYEKKLLSQYETSIRVYYPDFGFTGSIARIAGLAVLLLPYCLVVSGALSGDYFLATIAFVVTIVISLLNAWYLGVVRSNNYGIASVCLPFIMLREMCLLAASIIMYKFGMVTWKGRPVSINRTN